MRRVKNSAKAVQGQHQIIAMLVPAIITLHQQGKLKMQQKSFSQANKSQQQKLSNIRHVSFPPILNIQSRLAISQNIFHQRFMQAGSPRFTNRTFLSINQR